MTPYAFKYQKKHGAVPWAILLSKVMQGAKTVPWLPLLPPEAKGSLYEWGRYLFSQTPACKRGSVSVDVYGDWIWDANGLSDRVSAAEVLAKFCAAFAYSPLSWVIDIRAAVQCITQTLRRVLGTEESHIPAVSQIEDELDRVCAAGCGNNLSQGHTHRKQYGAIVRYCSEECADKVSVLLVDMH